MSKTLQLSVNPRALCQTVAYTTYRDSGDFSPLPEGYPWQPGNFREKSYASRIPPPLKRTKN